MTGPVDHAQGPGGRSASAFLLDAVDPVADERGQQLRLLPRQAMPSTVQNGQRRPRVAIHEIERPAISDNRVLPTEDEQRRFGERHGWRIHGSRDPIVESIEERFVAI